MKPAEFGERQFEMALYRQLELTATAWAPEQVLEHYLGFDAGLFLSRAYLWNLHGHPRPLAGISLFRDMWPLLGPSQVARSQLPSFDLNCFIQTKRPYVGKRLRAELRLKGLVLPFYKFEITPEQQQCLERISGTLRDRALFVYAAAAFATSSELFQHMASGTMVEHSTFPSVEQLAGHGAWYYSQGGATGIPNPSFERSEGPSLLDRIAAFLRLRQGRGERRTISENLASLAGLVREAAGPGDRVSPNAREAYFVQEWESIAARGRRYEAPPAVTAVAQIATFAEFFSLSWMVIDDSIRS